MSSSNPQSNPLASTVLTALGYAPVIVNGSVGVDFANVAVLGMFAVTKIGNIVRVVGQVQYDTTGAVTGEQLCELKGLPLNSVVAHVGGSGLTTNAKQKGGAEGSGVIAATFDKNTLAIKLVVDSQQHIAAGYVAAIEITLIVLDADAT